MRASDTARSLSVGLSLRLDGSTCLADYADFVRRSPHISIETFLRTRPAEDRFHLAGLVALEMRERWRGDAPEPLENYLARYPELRDDKEQLLDLIYAEYCLKAERDGAAGSEEYYERFPDYRESLARLFCVHDLIGRDADPFAPLDRPVPLPEAGGAFLDFLLVRELGRGAFGRVFLARQTTLGDRLVALKITARPTIEPETMARMDHPHIVPVYSVHHDEASGLQAVCMPYRAAVALSQVLAGWRDGAATPPRGDGILAAVRAAVPPEGEGDEPAAAAAVFPKRADFAYACAWIMHQLADALAHAHERGVCHRDLKPSNILCTTGGQPLLVDFHLASNEAVSTGRAAIFGGTLPYMPPEQLEALQARARDSAAAIGPRSDLFSLAASVFELLTGRLPFEPPAAGEGRSTVFRAQLEHRRAGAPSVRRWNPNVPADLDRLIAKCLDPDPERRYETAQQLAGDLERFLDDRPLAHIGRVSYRTRVVKAVRRNRRALLFSGIVLFLALSAVFGALARRPPATQGSDAELGAAEPRSVEDELAALPREPASLLPWRYFNTGWEYFDHKRYRDAIVAFDEAIDKLGYHEAPVFFFRGKCHAALDEDDKALADYERAIEADPKYFHAYLARMMLRTTAEPRLRDYDKAFADAEHALALQHPGDKHYARVLFDVSRAYSAASRDRPELLEKAERYFFEAKDNGYNRDDVLTFLPDDRYDTMGPLLQLPQVQQYLERAADPVAARNP